MGKLTCLKVAKAAQGAGKAINVPIKGAESP
jgi:hypothetical protein